MGDKDKVAAALGAYKAASIAVCSAVKAAYPVGMVVMVKIGRSTFEARIKSHNDCWWSSPGNMLGTNLSTGKVRRFTPDHIVS